ncbi:MAG: hypothetical protein JXR76_16520 [Deltaproteobacteria bacterium]|nr:hypothetical protein [Deltaproteobacteria bacterium]
MRGDKIGKMLFDSRFKVMLMCCLALTQLGARRCDEDIDTDTDFVESTATSTRVVDMSIATDTHSGSDSQSGKQNRILSKSESAIWDTDSHAAQEDRDTQSAPSITGPDSATSPQDSESVASDEKKTKTGKQKKPSNTTKSSLKKPGARTPKTAMPMDSSPDLQALLFNPDDTGRMIDSLRYGEIYAISEYISAWKQKPVVVDSKVVESDAAAYLAEGTSPMEVQLALLSLLKMNGFTLLDEGDHLEILPTADAVKKVLPQKNKKPLFKDEVIAITHSIRSTSAPELEKLLTNFMSKDGRIIVLEQSNELMVTDYASNMEVIRAMLKQLDPPLRGTSGKNTKIDSDTETDTETTVNDCHAFSNITDTDEDLKTAEISFSRCGCVSDSKNQVYGFLNAQDKLITLEEQLYHRIQFGPLSYNKDGDLWKADEKGIFPSIFQDEQNMAFFDAARRHKVKVDLRITKSDWCQPFGDLSNTCNSEIRNQLHRMTTIGVGLIQHRINNAYNGFTQLSRPGAEYPTTGDGITIYFQRFPCNERASALFLDEILKMKKMLRNHSKKTGEHLFLNIEFSQDQLCEKTDECKGIYSYGSLINYVKPFNDAVEVRLLIHLNEPNLNKKERGASKQKKKLRQDFENAYTGSDRAKMLRRIVPILPRNSTCKDEIDTDQMMDDVIYFKDNFGGAGFPCMTVLGEEKNKDVVNQVKMEFHQDNNEYSDKIMLSGIVQHVPGCVCAWRWELRIIFNLLALLFLVLAIVSFFSFRLNQLVKRFRWQLYIGLTLFAILEVLLILFDPNWYPYILPSIIFITLGLFVKFYSIYQNTQNRQNFP